MVRALHFDCFSGISGDMTLGALLDAGALAKTVRRRDSWRLATPQKTTSFVFILMQNPLAASPLF